MKYSTSLLSLFFITISITSCTSEQEKTATVVTDNYVRFVDSIVNLYPDSAQVHWKTIDKNFEKKTSEINVEVDKLEDNHNFDAKIDSATAKYEAFRNSIILQKLKHQNKKK